VESGHNNQMTADDMTATRQLAHNVSCRRYFGDCANGENPMKLSVAIAILLLSVLTMWFVGTGMIRMLNDAQANTDARLVEALR
jgi:hypothetical protein